MAKGKSVGGMHNIATVPTDEIEVTKVINKDNNVGKFIVLNTNNVKGVRINTARLNNYAANSDTSIQLAWGDGISSTLQFGSKELLQEALELLDSKCL